MVVPETDAYASTARFAIPYRSTATAVALFCCFTVAIPLVSIAWNGPEKWRIAGTIAAILASLFSLATAVRVDNIEIDISARSYMRRHGWCGYSKTVVWSLNEVEVLKYIVSERAATISGLPEPVYRAWLEAPTGRLPLICGWRHPQAVNYLTVLAERLNVAAEAATSEPSNQRMARVGVIAVWAGILGMFCLMIWPVLTRQRQVHSPWESLFQDNTGRGPAHFKLYNRAMTAYRQQDFREAESLLAQAISAGYDSADGYNMMAYAQAGQLRLDDALKTAKRALSFAPDSGFILDTVGEMHELRKEFNLAEEFYRRALTRLAGDTVETQAKLGRTLLALNRRTEALEYLRSAALQPDVPYGAKAVDILKGLGERVPTMRGNQHEYRGLAPYLR